MTSILAQRVAAGSTTLPTRVSNELSQNQLVVLAGSPKGAEALFDSLSRLSGEVLPDPDNHDSATLKVVANRDTAKGITCFQLIRLGHVSNAGVVAVVVFNGRSNITRY